MDEKERLRRIDPILAAIRAEIEHNPISYGQEHS